MHDIPDTEDADAESERFWPEGYKDILWSELMPGFTGRILEADAFRSSYEQNYKKEFRTYEEWISRLGEMVAIGAENGSDKIFDEIYTAFSHGSPLPRLRPYARYFWPDIFNDEITKHLQEQLRDEYKAFHPYEHIYKDHYQELFSFDGFIDAIADLVAVGARKGADDMLGTIYRAFLGSGQLPIARRRPKRIR
jgi:hypothetical protein